MKATQRISKAIVVIIVVGIGLLHNMKEKSIVMEPFREMTAEFEKSQLKSDTVQSGESKLFLYTKSIINTTIQKLISTI